MFFLRKHLLIAFLIFTSFCLGENHNFSVTPENYPEINSLHWKHSATNSAFDINGIEVDILNWRVAADSRESVQVELLNPIWDFIGWNDNELVLPNVIKISDPVNYRGTPTIYIQVSPWRIIDNQIEVLTSGNISISVKPIDFPVNYSHPYLLNGDENELHRSFSNETEYLIITSSLFASAAQELADMHSDSVDVDFRLNTEVVIVEDIATDATNYEIREYIITKILDNSNLKFLLLFGDEIDIPPLFKHYLDIDGNPDKYPSDDYYTTPEIFNGDPQLVTGRIPINNSNDANNVAEKIYNYIINPSPGIWRSKIALVADDMHRSCSINNTQMERSHTIYTDNLFDFLNPFVPVIPYYGIHYELQQTAGCTQPDLTLDFIQTINNGIALINYIGHGDNQSWGDEKYITKSRDLSLIHSEENKLAIWVAGTCSFGNYYENNSFMEELLIKENGAIAIIATTKISAFFKVIPVIFSIEAPDIRKIRS